MKNLFNFFFSFDKLMKEGLVRAFFWLSLINIALRFFARSLDAIKLSWFAAVFEFFQFFVGFLLAVIVLRLLCELAIAIFRINDNVSPDGGKSETADIDPVMEARRAAEGAAKRAQELSKSAGEKTRDTFHDVSEKVSDAVPHKKAAANDTPKPAPKVDPGARTTSAKKAPTKKAAVKKPAVKKAAAPKTAAKKPAAKKSTPKTTAAKKAPTLNKDGSPRKKRAPNKKTPKS